jgi:hypothetical protein
LVIVIFINLRRSRLNWHNAMDDTVVLDRLHMPNRALLEAGTFARGGWNRR